MHFSSGKFNPPGGDSSPRIHSGSASDVNKDWTCKDKDKDKDLTHKDQDKDKDLNLVLKDKDKDFTYSYLLQVAAKPTLAIKQQQ